MTIEELNIKMQLAQDMKELNDIIYRITDACVSVQSRLTSLVNNPFYTTEASNEEKARVDNIASIHSQFMVVLQQLEI